MARYTKRFARLKLELYFEYSQDEELFACRSASFIRSPTTQVVEPEENKTNEPPPYDIILFSPTWLRLMSFDYKLYLSLNTSLTCSPGPGHISPLTKFQNMQDDDQKQIQPTRNSFQKILFQLQLIKWRFIWTRSAVTDHVNPCQRGPWRETLRPIWATWGSSSPGSRGFNGEEAPVWKLDWLPALVTPTTSWCATSKKHLPPRNVLVMIIAFWNHFSEDPAFSSDLHDGIYGAVTLAK